MLLESLSFSGHLLCSELGFQNHHRGFMGKYGGPYPSTEIFSMCFRVDKHKAGWQNTDFPVECYNVVEYFFKLAHRHTCTRKHTPTSGNFFNLSHICWQIAIDLF